MSYIKMGDKEFRCSICDKVVKRKWEEDITDAIYKHYYIEHSDVFTLIKEIHERFYTPEEENKGG